MLIECCGVIHRRAAAARVVSVTRPVVQSPPSWCLVATRFPRVGVCESDVRIEKEFVNEYRYALAVRQCTVTAAAHARYRSGPGQSHVPASKEERAS